MRCEDCDVCIHIHCDVLCILIHTVYDVRYASICDVYVVFSRCGHVYGLSTEWVGWGEHMSCSRGTCADAPTQLLVSCCSQL